LTAASTSFAEGFTIFPEVLQGSVDQAVDLLFQLVVYSAIGREIHPAVLDALADGLIDLRGPEEIGHLVAEVAFVSRGSLYVNHGFSSRQSDEL
jgi:hypothetical protein